VDVTRTFVWEEQLPSAVVNAASWRLAAELVAGVQGGHIEQGYGGGGQYDELVITNPDGTVRLSVNRNGRLHVLEAPTRCEPVELWPDACRPGAAEKIAAQVLAASGLAGARNRRGARVGYQVIAHLLTARALDSTPWDAIQLTSDVDAEHPRRPVAAELDAPGEDIWAVVAGDATIAWFYDGWVVWPGGERLDLTRERAAGVSLGELAGHVTRRRLAGTATALTDQLPASRPEDDPQAWLQFAGRYNAYQRLAAEPHTLEHVLDPARREYQRSGTVPGWCGPDLLRAWLFLLFRVDHFAGGYLFTSDDHADSVEFKAVAAAWEQRSGS
jgi:hypothetical protein